MCALASAAGTEVDCNYLVDWIERKMGLKVGPLLHLRQAIRSLQPSPKVRSQPSVTRASPHRACVTTLAHPLT
jgi:hypothetical protein